MVDEESSIGTEDDGLIESNQSFSSSKKLDEMRTGSNFLKINNGKNNFFSNVLFNFFLTILGLIFLWLSYYIVLRVGNFLLNPELSKYRIERLPR